MSKKTFASVILSLSVLAAETSIAFAEGAMPVEIPTGQASIQTKESRNFDHSHRLWDKLLLESVRLNGAKSAVHYGKLRTAPTVLSKYLKQLSEVTQSEFNQFSEPQKLSYLINAYNAFTLALVVNHYPVNSIKKIGGWFSTPWKIKFFRLLEDLRSLDDIEHEMLRKWFDEPRIHFALVCAARSCPPLRNQAYVPDRLENQLTEAASQFLKDGDRNYSDLTTKTVYLSSIFKWYGNDFNKKYGSALNFVASFISGSELDRKLISDSKVQVEHLDYDWSLNDATL